MAPGQPELVAPGQPELVAPGQPEPVAVAPRSTMRLWLLCGFAAAVALVAVAGADRGDSKKVVQGREAGCVWRGVEGVKLGNNRDRSGDITAEHRGEGNPPWHGTAWLWDPGEQTLSPRDTGHSATSTQCRATCMGTNQTPGERLFPHAGGRWG